MPIAIAISQVQRIKSDQPFSPSSDNFISDRFSCIRHPLVLISGALKDNGDRLWLFTQKTKDFCAIYKRF